MSSVGDASAESLQFTYWQSLQISHRVPKHIEKEGLGEAALQGQGGAALGSEGFGLVEDGSDTALFF